MAVAAVRAVTAAAAIGAVRRGRRATAFRLRSSPGIRLPTGYGRLSRLHRNGHQAGHLHECGRESLDWSAGRTDIQAAMETLGSAISRPRSLDGRRWNRRGKHGPTTTSANGLRLTTMATIVARLALERPAFQTEANGSSLRISCPVWPVSWARRSLQDSSGLSATGSPVRLPLALQISRSPIAFGGIPR